jgi:peptide deformylase
MSIKIFNHSALTSVSKEVERDEDVSELLDAMWLEMKESRGIGLAANQIGVLKRVIIINAKGFSQEFINPVITKKYGGKAMSVEGCLSFPGIQVKVSRYKNIVIEGLDGNMNPVKRKLKGLQAYCAQHEVDHLNGITIESKMKARRISPPRL